MITGSVGLQFGRRTVDIATGKQTRLTKRRRLPVRIVAFLGPTDISPDGKRDEFLNTVGRISPDGHFIAYRSDEAQPERGEIYVRPFKTASAETGDGKWRLSKDGVQAMLHWRADGKEVFWRGLNLETNELNVMSVDVTTTPAFSVVGTPKQLFKLPGPLAGNLGNISRDGQRFVFAVNVAAAAPTTAPR